jgi:RNA 3'-terminal phosphate cyclase (ATP)
VLHIDGAAGEGGGQVLRTALGLSIATGQPFRIERIRAARAQPGLGRQHLCAVQAAAEVSRASVSGAELGSREVVFRPGRVRGGSYRFAIDTAGSTTLVLQTVLPALLAAEAPAELELHGGTHNPMAPPFEFLELAFAPLLARMGAGLQLELRRAGFYPAGGGELRARIAPVPRLQPIELLRREGPEPPRALVLSARLPAHVAEREREALRAELPALEGRIEVREVGSAGPGNCVLVSLPARSATEVVMALGERGVPAEVVARRAARAAREFLAADVPVGAHLADQLLIPMALAGGGEFRTVVPTLHTATNAAVVERFLSVRFAIGEDQARPGTWLVRCGPR